MAAGVTLTRVPGSSTLDDCRAWVRNDCTLRVCDQSAAPTPPGIAQSRYTSVASGSDIADSTRTSMAASWAAAPSGVRGKPDDTPLAPTVVAAGSLIAGGRAIATPGVRPASSATVAIGAAAIASRRWPGSSSA